MKNKLTNEQIMKMLSKYNFEFATSRNVKEIKDGTIVYGDEYLSILFTNTEEIRLKIEYLINLLKNKISNLGLEIEIDEILNRDKDVLFKEREILDELLEFLERQISK